MGLERRNKDNTTKQAHPFGRMDAPQLGNDETAVCLQMEDLMGSREHRIQTKRSWKPAKAFLSFAICILLVAAESFIAPRAARAETVRSEDSFPPIFLTSPTEKNSVKEYKEQLDLIQSEFDAVSAGHAPFQKSYEESLARKQLAKDALDGCLSTIDAIKQEAKAVMNEAVELSKSEMEKRKEALSEAEKNLDAAYERLSKARASFDKASQEASELYLAYERALAAKGDIDEAKVAEYFESVKGAEMALQEAVDALNLAIEAKKNADELLEAARSALDAAGEAMPEDDPAVVEAGKAKAEAAIAEGQKKNELDLADIRVVMAQKDIDEKVSELANLEAVKAALEEILAEKEKALSEAQAAKKPFDDAVAELQDELDYIGSDAFLDAWSFFSYAGGGEDAKQILINNGYEPDNRNDGTESAISMRNIKASIEALEEYGRLKYGEAADESLRVNMLLMAAAMVNVDDAAKNGANHTNTFNGVQECIAWGEENPFGKWAAVDNEYHAIYESYFGQNESSSYDEEVFVGFAVAGSEGNKTNCLLFYKPNKEDLNVGEILADDTFESFDRHSVDLAALKASLSYCEIKQQTERESAQEFLAPRLEEAKAAQAAEQEKVDEAAFFRDEAKSPVDSQLREIEAKRTEIDEAVSGKNLLISERDEAEESYNQAVAFRKQADADYAAIFNKVLFNIETAQKDAQEKLEEAQEHVKSAETEIEDAQHNIDSKDRQLKLAEEQHRAAVALIESVSNAYQQHENKIVEKDSFASLVTSIEDEIEEIESSLPSLRESLSWASDVHSQARSYTINDFLTGKLTASRDATTHNASITDGTYSAKQPFTRGRDIQPPDVFTDNQMATLKRLYDQLGMSLEDQEAKQAEYDDASTTHEDIEAAYLPSKELYDAAKNNLDLAKAMYEKASMSRDDPFIRVKSLYGNELLHTSDFSGYILSAWIVLMAGVACGLIAVAVLIRSHRK